MHVLLTAETIPVDQLLQGTHPANLKQGRELYRQGRARVEQTNGASAVVTVNETDKLTFPVKATLSNAAGGFVQLQCGCRGSGWGLCKHRVAAALALRDHLKANPPAIWRAVLDQAIKSPTRQSVAPPSANVIVFSLQERGQAWTVVPYSMTGRLLPPGHNGDLEIITNALERQKLGDQLKPIRSQVTPESYPTMPVAAVAAANTAVAASTGAGGGYGAWFTGPRTLATILAMLPGCIVYGGDEKQPIIGGRLFVNTEVATTELELERDPGFIEARFRLAVDGRHVTLRPGYTHVLSREPLWILADDQVFRLADGGPDADLMAAYPRVRIPVSEEADFIEHYLVPLSASLPVRGQIIQWETVEEQPAPRVYLSEQDGELEAELRFAYGPFELEYERAMPAESVQRQEGSAVLYRVRRDPEAERALFQQLAGGFGLKRSDEEGAFTLRKGTTPLDFLLREVPRLAAAGFTIFGEETLTVARVNRSRPSISFNVTTPGADWFDVEAVIRFGDQLLSLKELKRALRRRERYIKLADGSLGTIPEEWVERYRHLFAFGEERGPAGLRLAQHHAAVIDQALEGADQSQVDQAFADARERFQDFTRIERQPLPRGFVGTLRPYQKAGVDWLHFLRRYKFGGILADDMGLGKTVTTLALLQSVYEEQPRPGASLIVMPRSLLINWQREAAQFAPGLRVHVHADQGRIREPAQFGEHDVILTTYGVLLRDIDLLKGYTFHYAILDESQAIKNPAAETSRAARALVAEHRLALTGTPIENTTAELWSQFAFLNPGLLGNLEYFRDQFVGPIERRQDENAAQLLRRIVFPFILRRTKDQVATDLPPRSEELLVVDLDQAQRKLYVKTRDYYRALLLGMIDGQGMDDARMKILEGLLRLRQICNHPRLIDGKFRGTSAKYELLLDTLDTLRAEGHKALIFSQFVQMLGLIREGLDARGVPYAYLDGSTADRQAEVDRFQQTPDLPFFLISLRAGGVGLNLTAADYVIHVDPWWNPAVEAQATDRAHRIGQTKPVFVYKLIARDTVEEKIVQLQEQKRAIASQVISSEGGVFKALTRDDVEALFS
ncbi:MAG TPA: DEAD/DEAH box helicase [Chloroflexaceae bacterium]|nr:DEAD/DEAH box helicase [Chloroflexaceae bacterium]